MAIDPSTLYQASSAPSTNGGALFLDQYFAFVGGLVDTAILRLVSVGGTADAITASAEPFEVPSTGLVTGMKFTLEPTADNTGAATLNIDGRGAESIVTGSGAALSAGDLANGTRYLLEFDGTNFVILNSASVALQVVQRLQFDATATWTNDLPATAVVVVELWGAGAGAGGSGGGGGGAYATKTFLASDLPPSVSITVPAGGAAGTNGGDASFGTLLTAQGGFTAGTGGGRSGLSGFAASWAGGSNGENAQFGGAGADGTSVLGGNGGEVGAAAIADRTGQAPGGGAGSPSAPGGDGRCVLTIFGG
jgi:hypothetical protein